MSTRYIYIILYDYGVVCIINHHNAIEYIHIMYETRLFFICNARARALAVTETRLSREDQKSILRIYDLKTRKVH